MTSLFCVDLWGDTTWGKKFDASADQMENRTNLFLDFMQHRVRKNLWLFGMGCISEPLSQKYGFPGWDRWVLSDYLKINSIIHFHPQVCTHLWKQLFADWLVLCMKQSNTNWKNWSQTFSLPIAGFIHETVLAAQSPVTETVTAIGKVW